EEKRGEAGECEAGKQGTVVEYGGVSGWPSGAGVVVEQWWEWWWSVAVVVVNGGCSTVVP
ncbi:hypothetical protein SOVF_164920, partial [Spinacia oleracea]